MSVFIIPEHFYHSSKKFSINCVGDIIFGFSTSISEKSLSPVTRISTSSIIEGVNTSAENVIVWMTSGRGLQFSNFAYKNLIGRAGRMFKHFIGNIYVLAKRPNDTETQLAIPFPEEILGDLDKEK